VIITQHGKSVAVLLDAYEYETIQEKLELLADVHASINQLEHGEGMAHKDAKEKVLKRIRNGIGIQDRKDRYNGLENSNK